MPAPGTGLAGELGIRRRDDPRAYQAAWRERNREEYNAYQRAYHKRKKQESAGYREMKRKAGKWYRRKKKYGLTRDEYEKLLTEQGGLCIICGDEVGEALRVDHDHTTGKVRGLLCSSCNTGLGYFYDNPESLRKAAWYLEKNAEKCEADQ
jgi:Autographiviridae endonuclease VII